VGSGSAPAAQSSGQSAQAQEKPVDDAAGKSVEGDAKSVRKQERRSGRRYARDDRYPRDNDPGGRSTEVREAPRDETPFPFFETRRWRPLFDDDD
jgi:hypothetical protein